MPRRPHPLIPLAAAALLATAVPAQAAFTGGYAPANWTTGKSNGGNGTVATDASTLQLTSSNFTNFDDAPLDPSTLSFSITVSDAASIAFHWTYVTHDDNGSTNDTFGYAVGPTFVQLSVDGSYADQSGDATVSVHPGDVFAFRTTSTDNVFGSAVSTVTSFQATAPVPDAPGGLLALAAVPFAIRWWQRRKPAGRPLALG